MAETNPTDKNYGVWRQTYDYFNVGLFKGLLPGCLITFQRQRCAYGFHVNSRFEAPDNEAKIDEIALNPSCFDIVDVRYVLSILVHEMAHQYQWHFGKPGRRGYHNKGWARLMIEIGLVPTDTGQAGGKATGRRVGHYIREGGPFDRLCAELLNSGFVIPFKETNFWEVAGIPLNPDDPEMKELIELQKREADEQRKKKAASKTRYTCPNCDPLIHIWGKRGLHVVCGVCNTRFEVDASDEGWPIE